MRSDGRAAGELRQCQTNQSAHSVCAHYTHCPCTLWICFFPFLCLVKNVKNEIGNQTRREWSPRARYFPARSAPSRATHPPRGAAVEAKVGARHRRAAHSRPATIAGAARSPRPSTLSVVIGRTVTARGTRFGVDENSINQRDPAVSSGE